MVVAANAAVAGPSWALPYYPFAEVVAVAPAASVGPEAEVVGALALAVDAPGRAFD